MSTLYSSIWKDLKIQVVQPTSEITAAEPFSVYQKSNPTNGSEYPPIDYSILTEIDSRFNMFLPKNSGCSFARDLQGRICERRGFAWAR